MNIFFGQIVTNFLVFVYIYFYFIFTGMAQINRPTRKHKLSIMQ